MLAEATQKALEKESFENKSTFEFTANNEAQGLAWETKANIVYFGGIAGAGKTFLIAAKAVLKHHRSLLIRKHYIDHKGSEGLFEVVERISSIRPNKTDGIFEFPDGRKIILGGTDYIGKFFGKPHDLIAVDELPEIPKTFFETIIGWNRTTVKGQQCQVFCGGNPPLNPEGEWVVDYFAPWLKSGHPNPAKPGELRWFAKIGDQDVEVPDSNPVHDPSTNTMVQPWSRTFIPGKMVSYLKETGYETTLQNMPEAVRRKLLFGDFSIRLDDDIWQVIPRAWVLAAMERHKKMPRPSTAITSVGNDCARGGKDKHVIAERRGNWYAPLRKYAGHEVKDGQAALSLFIDIPIGDAPLNIDVIGIGSSVYDFAKEKYNAIPVNFGEAADENATDRSKKFKFANKRAQYVWRFREALDPEHGDDLALPDDQELLTDLCAMRYKIQSGKIRIELKDEIKERLGRSPDCGEAVILADANTAQLKQRSYFAIGARTEAEVMGR